MATKQTDRQNSAEQQGMKRCPIMKQCLPDDVFHQRLSTDEPIIPNHRQKYSLL